MKKILIVLADYYEDISSSLLKTAKNNLSNYAIKIIKVPGVFEVPVTIAKNIKKYDAFIALGCVIKGETPHFDYISSATTQSIMKLSVDNRKPLKIEGHLSRDPRAKERRKYGLKKARKAPQFSKR